MNRPAADTAILQALERVLTSLEAVRNGRAFCVLLGSLAAAGLLLSMASGALARDASLVAVVEAGLAFFVAFYGTNATGLLLLDQARGQRDREAGDAVRDALFSAHRLLAVLCLALLAVLVVVAALALLLWLARADMLGPRWGALLFGLALPLSVVVVGVLLLLLSTVVAPLAAPAVWSGMGVRATLRLVLQQLRSRPLFVVLLSAAATLLAGAMAALVAAVVVGGGRVVALGTVFITGLDIPPQQLMAGLFGYGLRSLGAAGAPVAQSPYGVTALTGGGVVFVCGLVLPALVYLRGLCAVLLSVQPPAPVEPESWS